MGRQGGHGRRRAGRALAALVAVLAWALLGGAGPASAHAVPTGSDPREGTVLKTAPRQVTVTFNESVELAEDSVRVLDPDGRPVTGGDPEHADGRADTARVPLAGGLDDGTYTVTWRVLSADGHAVSGAFTFSLGAPSPTPAEAAARQAVDPAVDVLDAVGRHTAYAGVALLIGIAVFVLVCRPGTAAVRALRGPFLAGWWALAVSTAALLLVRGPYESGDGPAGALDPELLGRTVTGRPGLALLSRLALLLLLALILRRLPPERWADRRTVIAGTALAVGLAATWAAADHAATGIQVPVALVSAVLHLLAMAVWLGGLAALLYTLYRSPEPAALPPAAVTRFSRLALASVTVLAATGVYQSWRGLGAWDAFTTPYGRMLALKTMAVTLMLVAASCSRNWTERLRQLPREEERTPVLVTAGGGAEAPPPGPETGARGTSGSGPGSSGPGSSGPGPGAARRGLRRSVLAEVVIGVVVLAVTTVLTGSQPARSAAEAAPASAVPGRPDVNLTEIPFDTGAADGRGRVQITLEPGRVGRNVVEAVVYGTDGSLIAIPELRLTFTHAEQQVGPLDAELADQRGYWGSDTLDLPLAGTWTARATVRVSDIDQVTVEATVQVTP
ncbi:copper resistance CopC/CopD family protein [Streptomyces poriticola]|uniref:copper resistance CopC/CopD family protein n=1 Tax=Streptomyces poriticola TaxID=3120506 RepID=UPI002FCE65DA